MLLLSGNGILFDKNTRVDYLFSDRLTGNLSGGSTQCTHANDKSSSWKIRTGPFLHSDERDPVRVWSAGSQPQVSSCSTHPLFLFRCCVCTVCVCVCVCGLSQMTCAAEFHFSVSTLWFHSGFEYLASHPQKFPMSAMSWVTSHPASQRTQQLMHRWWTQDGYITIGIYNIAGNISSVIWKIFKKMWIIKFFCFESTPSVYSFDMNNFVRVDNWFHSHVEGPQS